MTLAERLGRTSHISPLRMRLRSLWLTAPCKPDTLEDWLVDVANARGARVVMREGTISLEMYSRELTNEELVVGLLLAQNRDRPQMLRLAAQLISRQAVNFTKLANIAVQERVGFILAELARQACKVKPEHPVWGLILREFGKERAPASSLLHYTRLAEPVMKNGRVSDGSWVLVS
jgi:hypothetical protein